MKDNNYDNGSNPDLDSQINDGTQVPDASPYAKPDSQIKEETIIYAQPEKKKSYGKWLIGVPVAVIAACTILYGVSTCNSKPNPNTPKTTIVSTDGGSDLEGRLQPPVEPKPVKKGPYTIRKPLTADYYVTFDEKTPESVMHEGKKLYGVKTENGLHTIAINDRELAVIEKVDVFYYDLNKCRFNFNIGRASDYTCPEPEKIDTILEDNGKVEVDMRDSGTYRLNVTIRENGKKVTQPLYVRIGNNNKPDVSLPTGLFTDNEPQKQEPALVVQPDTSADPTDKYDAVRKRAERAFDELDKEVEKLQGQDKQNKLEVQPKVEPVCDVKCTIKRKLIQRQN